MFSGKSKIRTLALLAALVALLAASSCRRAQWRTAEGVVWGTTYNITYFSDKDLTDSIVAEMRLVEKSLSMFDPTSNVSRINARQTDTLTNMTYEVFVDARAISNVSGGMFDPTVGPLTDLWGFGRKGRKLEAVPDSMTIAEALAGVGIAQCTVSSSTRRIHLKTPGTELDFSAIAKGYGVDCVGNVLTRNHVKDFLVEIGGEMTMEGLNRDGKPWHIQIVSPESGPDSNVPLCSLDLTGCSVATSGNYRNFHVLPDGSKIGHTLSPLTGYPIVTDVMQATVISPRCIIADALATACMAMGSDAALNMISANPEISVLMVTAGPGGKLRKILFGAAFDAPSPRMEPVR